MDCAVVGRRELCGKGEVGGDNGEPGWAGPFLVSGIVPFRGRREVGVLKTAFTSPLRCEPAPPPGVGGLTCGAAGICSARLGGRPCDSWGDMGWGESGDAGVAGGGESSRSEESGSSTSPGGRAGDSGSCLLYSEPETVESLSGAELVAVVGVGGAGGGGWRMPRAAISKSTAW